ncbi:lytic transglycosylase domain-containing protein [bacterium]|nr:lytic transglycosylase domain-containing protein [bacterium]
MRKFVVLPLLLIGLALPATAASQAPSLAKDDPVVRFITSHYGRAKAERFAPLIHEKATKHGHDPLLIARLIKLESDFQPRERTGDAMGLMQIRKGHARRGEDLYDPATNLEFGCRLLAEYTRMFGGDKHKGLSAYLHGPIYVANRGVRHTKYSRRLMGE